MRIPAKITHLSSKGQLTIPRRVIQQLGWQAKQPLTITRVHGAIVIAPPKTEGTSL